MVWTLIASQANTLSNSSTDRTIANMSLKALKMNRIIFDQGAAKIAALINFLYKILSALNE